MPKNPPNDMPRITPYLYYNDVERALSWLSKTFGLQKRFEMPGADGRIAHAEMTFEEGVIMLGLACPEHKGRSPSELEGVNQGLYVYVGDVDSHHQKTVSEGAIITVEPVDMFWGDRLYSVKDLEGHQWTFAQHVKDVAPADMKPG